MMKINFHAPIVIADGYGSASCNILLWMDKLGVDVYPVNMYPSNTNPDTLPPRLLELMNKGEKPGDLMYYVNPAFAKFNPRFDGQQIVVMSMLETSKVPRHWVERYNEVSLIHNPSQWGKNIFEASGVKAPIEVMNLGVPPEKIEYVEREFDTPFVFLFVTTEVNDERKNVPMLLEAFIDVFGSNPDVELWVKSKTNCRWPLPDNDNIVVFEGEATLEEMSELMVRANCFVFPTRGEGFGLPPLEAMATGCPVIATDYSSMREFLSDDVAYLLCVERMESIDQKTKTIAGMNNYPEPIFGEDIGDWAIPSKEHLSELMINVWENYDAALQRGLNAFNMVKAEWGYDKKVSRIITSLERMLI